MFIRIWGARGSLPKPGKETLRYGGNTSCVEVRAADGTLVVLDCGSGAHALGQALMQAKEKPAEGHILLTHTHWDHIQGFPFFAPLFAPDTAWHIYAPGFRGRKLKDILGTVMSYSFFPISLDGLGASIRFHDLTEGVFDIGSVRVSCRYMNHPTLTFGYRLEADGSVFVYAPDHEPNFLPEGNGGEARPVHREDQGHLDFIGRADLLLHDAQYTLQEYREKAGWGHSPVERVMDDAVVALVRRLGLFHHDPLRDDRAVDLLVRKVRQRAAGGTHRPEIFAAAEGQRFELGKNCSTAHPPSPVRTAAFPPLRLPGTVLVVERDAGELRRILEVVAPEDFRVATARDAQSALRTALAERVGVVVVGPGLWGKEGRELARALRESVRPDLGSLPILMVGEERMQERDLQTCYEAGATDCLTKSFPPVTLRARICAWLLRAAGE